MGHPIHYSWIFYSHIHSFGDYRALVPHAFSMCDSRWCSLFPDDAPYSFAPGAPNVRFQDLYASYAISSRHIFLILVEACNRRAECRRRCLPCTIRGVSALRRRQVSDQRLWTGRHRVGPRSHRRSAEHGTVGTVAEGSPVEELTDDEQVRLLQAALADEREGRLVRCSTADEVRRVMAQFSKTGR